MYFPTSDGQAREMNAESLKIAIVSAVSIANLFYQFHIQNNFVFIQKNILKVYYYIFKTFGVKA